MGGGRAGDSLKRGSWYQRFVDVTARRPSGWLGRLLYRNPRPHFRSFGLVLEALLLTRDDALLDVCCGGGSFLQFALERAGRAAGLDHSADMIALTRERNAEACTQGRLDLCQGDATAPPWGDDTFDAVSNVNALVFLGEPGRFLAEVLRVLRPGGRLVIVTTARRRFGALLYGPWYPALALYADGELMAMMGNAGFTAIRVQTSGDDQVAYGVKGHDGG